MRVIILMLVMSWSCICWATTPPQNDPPLVSVTVDSIKSVSCAYFADGAIDISVSGGTPPLSYLWSNQATTEDISNLTAGSYKVTVTDATGAFVSSQDIPVEQG